MRETCCDCSTFENKDTNIGVDHIQHLALLMGYLEAKALANRDMPGRSKPSVHRLLNETARRLVVIDGFMVLERG